MIFPDDVQRRLKLLTDLLSTREIGLLFEVSSRFRVVASCLESSNVVSVCLSWTKVQLPVRPCEKFSEVFIKNTAKTKKMLTEKMQNCLI